MLTQLSDDCWFIVLKYLNLSDQLSLAQTASSLRVVVHNHWGRLKSALVDKDVEMCFCRQPDEMEEFLERASGSLQSLRFERSDFKQPKRWLKYALPNLVELYLDFGSSTDPEAYEYIIGCILGLSPNLRRISLVGSTSCPLSHMLSYRIEELNLLCCEFDMGILASICEKQELRKISVLNYGYNTNLGDDVQCILRCSTLEELVMDDHHLLGDFLAGLLQLPLFWRLAFYTRDYYEYILLSVAKLVPLRVRTLVFNDAFWSSTRVSHAIKSMGNLQCLALHEDDIETKELHTFCASLPHLKELHLTKMRALPTPTQLWEMVGACKTLTRLNLEGSKLDAQFLELSALCLDKALAKRSASSQLTLHLNETALPGSPNEIRQQLSHPNLRISFEPVDLNVLSSRFVQIELEKRAN